MKRLMLFLTPICLFAIFVSCKITQFTIPISCKAGDNIPATMTIKNHLSGPYEGEVKFYLSYDHYADPSDQYLGAQSYAKLEAGASITLNTTIPVPINLNTGDYFIIAQTPFDVAVRKLRVYGSIGNGVDLTPINFFMEDNMENFQTGRSYDVYFDVKNVGLTRASNAKIDIFLSKSPTLANDWVKVGNTSASNVGGKNQLAFSKQFRIPSNYTLGEAYIIVTVDTDNSISEFRELNNLISKAIIIKSSSNAKSEEVAAINSKVTAPSDTNPLIIEKDHLLNNGVEEFLLENGVNLFPNPTKNGTTLEFALKEAATIKLKLHDLSGKLINSFSYKRNKGAFKEQLDLSLLDAGAYWLNIQINETQLTKKVVVQ